MYLKFEDSDGLLYDVHASIGKNYTITEDNKQIEVDNIEKSFTPGSVIIGQKRFMSSIISIKFQINENNDSDFKDKVNNLFYWAEKAKYIIDDDNDLRTSVSLDSPAIGFDSGAYLRGGEVAIDFRRLAPYWEDNTEQTDTGSGTTIVKSINNSGYLPTPATFTITATTDTTGILIYITENGEGIEIQDLAFGSSSDLLEYIINNGNGTALLSGINRNDRINGGSGFFDFPVGNFTLNIEVPVSCSVSIAWRRRYYT